MRINRKKTEVMVCSKDFEDINIKMDDSALKQALKCKNQDSRITEDGKNKEDIIESGTEHAGEREGYSKDYTLYQRLTVPKNDLLMMSFLKARNM